MKQYAVLDIETTGMSPGKNRITEIAILIHDGTQILDSFQSLVNPECYVPEFITNLTGISNEMLQDAPRFFEIAKKVVELTEGKIIVAHNAHFDYGFLKNEFNRLGYKFHRQMLCTVRLSRKIFPKLPSYSLKNLTKYFNITLNQHHRAYADAKATCEILERLIEKSETKIEKNIISNEISTKTIPPKLPKKVFENLPEKTGVYYFYDEAGSIIYIGKSKNIKKRIATHFSSFNNQQKSIEFKNQIADISHELTGSELVALLLESDEIKKHTPRFNKAQRKTRYFYGIYERKSQKGYIRFYISRLQNEKKTPLTMTGRFDTAKKILEEKIEAFQLCQKLAGVYETKEACFHYQVKKCKGACINLEDKESYNKRARKAKATFDVYSQKTFIITDIGRNSGENAIILLEKGRYLGFGYVDKEVSISSFEALKSYIKPYQDNQDIQKIIYAWLKKTNWKGATEVVEDNL